MGQIKEYIKIAIMNIRHNRGRSVLTMLGIIIGITSVIMVISIGNGVRSQINAEMDSMAGGQVAFYVDTTRKDTTVRFEQADLDAIEAQIDHINGISYILGNWGTCDSPKVSMDVYCQGGTTGFYYNWKEPMVAGRFYNKSEFDSGANVCVVTENDAKKLFGTTDVVGLTFDITMWGISQEVRIVGVRKDANTGLISALGGGDDYITAVVPATFLANKFGYYLDEITQFYIFCEGPEYSVEIAKEVKSILESRHHCQGENQVLMENFVDYSAQYDSILSIITVFVSLVAAISLIVGGIGVMNIMLVSVTERTREIGIRKSLGAKTRSIMWQFLAEAGIITLLGGIIGIVIGVLGSVGICSVIAMEAQISISTIVIATVFSCSVGLFFGIYPAKKAAKLSPIEALRHE